MSVASSHALDRLADELEAKGLSEDADALREVQDELKTLERPPGLFRRMTAGMRKTASEQWGHVVGELQESQETWGLIRRRMATGEQLTPAESDKVKAQVADCFRVVPAGLLAACNSVFPVPGTGVFTPWLLKQLGLLPSRWREAHALSRLEKEHAHLLALGHVGCAERVHALIDQLEQEIDDREEAEASGALLTHWDANDNGVWDDDERAAYEQAVLDMRVKMSSHHSHKRWFFQLNAHVFGPVRLSEMGELEPEGPLLVCYDGKSGWVSYRELMG